MSESESSSAAARAVAQTKLLDDIDAYVKANFLDNAAGGKCCEDCNTATSAGEPFVHDNVYGSVCAVELLLKAAAILRESAAVDGPSQSLTQEWVNAEIERGHYSIIRGWLAIHGGKSAEIVREELLQLVRAAVDGARPQPSPSQGE